LIFAKIVIGSGGHQDNVFEEASTLCEWIIKFSDKNDIYIILIDTDLLHKFDRLKENYSNIDNLIIGNHIEIQQYFIDNYSICNK
jgi:vacuolar-type H+-ATPase subunit F/Vma7